MQFDLAWCISSAANVFSILAIAYGGPTMVMGFKHMAAGSRGAMKKVILGAVLLALALITPTKWNEGQDWAPLPNDTFYRDDRLAQVHCQDILRKRGKVSVNRDMR